MIFLGFILVMAFCSTPSDAVVNVERTVQQVQSILQANTQLPRLTRDEILQLLNDIRAEDSKSTSASIEQTTTEQPRVMSSQINEINVISTTTDRNDLNNEIYPGTQIPDIRENVVIDEKVVALSASGATEVIETTTKPAEPSVLVVLPYTPRDGSSLQELYTKPPRIEVVPVSKVTPKPTSIVKSDESSKRYANFNEKQKQDFPAELQAFLTAHGLKGKPGQDHFLLPLEGFKPLPPPRTVDGSIELPENLLLTYDLISPSDLKETTNNRVQQLPQNNYLYEPLRPQIPLELLDTSSSDIKKTVLPLDLPMRIKTKQPSYESVDYDSYKVIPLNKGPNPVEEEKVTLPNELSKRQTNDTKTDNQTIAQVTPSNDSKNATTNPPKTDSSASDTDTGASIADLEASFGGAAPEIPGDSQLPPPRKNGFYWMLDWNSFLEVGDGDTKVNIRFEPKLGDPQMFLPVNVP